MTYFSDKYSSSSMFLNLWVVGQAILAKMVKLHPVPEALVVVAVLGDLVLLE